MSKQKPVSLEELLQVAWNEQRRVKQCVAKAGTHLIAARIWDGSLEEYSDSSKVTAKDKDGDGEVCFSISLGAEYMAIIEEGEGDQEDGAEGGDDPKEELFYNLVLCVSIRGALINLYHHICAAESGGGANMNWQVEFIDVNEHPTIKRLAKNLREFCTDDENGEPLDDLGGHIPEEQAFQVITTIASYVALCQSECSPS